MADSTDVEALERDAFLAEAEMLARLTSSIGWEQYETLLSNMRAASMEKMSECDQGDFRYWQGVVQTLASIIERPHQVVQTAASVHEDEQDDAQKLLDVKRSLEMSPGLIDDL